MCRRQRYHQLILGDRRAIREPWGHPASQTLPTCTKAVVRACAEEAVCLRITPAPKQARQPMSYARRASAATIIGRCHDPRSLVSHRQSPWPISRIEPSRVCPSPVWSRRVPWSSVGRPSRQDGSNCVHIWLSIQTQHMNTGPRIRPGGSRVSTSWLGGGGQGAPRLRDDDGDAGMARQGACACVKAHALSDYCVCMRVASAPVWACPMMLAW